MTERNVVTFNYNRENKKKRQIIIHPDKHMFEFEGVMFREKTTKYKKIDGIEHIDKVIYEEVDTSEEQKKTDFIRSKLINKIPKERVVDEVLKNIPTKELNRIYRLLKKKKVVVKSQSGCFGLKIDGGKRNNCYIELFG
jgi:hypothetical protein